MVIVVASFSRKVVMSGINVFSTDVHIEYTTKGLSS